MSFFMYLIAFGGNTGDRVQNAHGALLCLRRFGRIGRQSEWKITEPLRSSRYDTSDHEVYLNFVMEFESELPPNALYRHICEIEDQFGHDREQRWRPRAVDLDLLFCSKQEKSGMSFEPDLAFEYLSSDGGLQLPHPQIWNRGFLLEMIESDLKINLNLLNQRKSDVSKNMNKD